MPEPLPSGNFFFTVNTFHKTEVDVHGRKIRGKPVQDDVFIYIRHYL